MARTVKNLPAKQDTWVHPWFWKIPWRRKWQPTPVFCLGNPMDKRAWRATVHMVARVIHVWMTNTFIQGMKSYGFSSSYVQMWVGKWVSEVTQSCLTLCDSILCSLPGFSIHGILQARILEWVTISFSRGSSQPRDQTQVSHVGGRLFNLWATREDESWTIKKA